MRLVEQGAGSAERREIDLDGFASQSSAPHYRGSYSSAHSLRRRISIFGPPRMPTKSFCGSGASRRGSRINIDGIECRPTENTSRGIAHAVGEDRNTIETGDRREPTPLCDETTRRLQTDDIVVWPPARGPNRSVSVPSAKSDEPRLPTATAEPELEPPEM